MKSALQSLGEGGWLWGPLAVCGSTILLVVHATRLPFSPAGAEVFCAGVIAAYGLDHWADLPTAKRSTGLLWLAGLAAASGGIAACSLPAWKFVLAAALGLVGLSYRQLKKWPMGKTILVAGTWTVAGVSFPVEWNAHHLFWAPFGGALLALFAAGALLCDFKDGAADSQAGVRTIVVMWGPRPAAGVAGLLALGGVLAALMAGRHGLAAAGVVLVALAASPKLVSRPVLGPALVDGALALPAVLILTGLA